MAKRKRLEVPKDPVSPDLETKSAFNVPRVRMPIAEVAGDMAGQAALEEVARAMTEAEAEGRVVKRLPLEAVQLHHLSRDRMVLDEADMAALVASIEARGQQAPIDVLRLSGGKYGLISGLRRMEALRRLGADTVLAFVRSPASSQEQFCAMVEENEIRAGLSFYERAKIAHVAVVQEVYPDVHAAISGIFANAPRAKRSKIRTFAVLHNKIGGSLTFPTAIPEKLGLALVRAIEADPGLVARISRALQADPPVDAAAERQVLEAAMKAAPNPKTEPERLAQGLSWQAREGRAVVSGPALTADFLEALRDFIVSHAKHVQK